MIYKAFDAFPLIKACPSKIESSVLWDSFLIVGCYDGSLRIYVEDSSDTKDSVDPDEVTTSEIGGNGLGFRKWMDETRDSKVSWKPKETRIGFARKAILQMDVIHSRSFLITLSDGVSIHSLPDLDMVTHFGKTRGGNVYAWNNGRGVLCTAVRKKLVFVKFTGSREFSEMKEVNVSDTVRTMAWSGDSLILGLATKKEYWLVDVPSGLLTEVSSSGRSSPPLVTALPGGELLLGKDNIGVFVDNQGKSTRPGEAISWSEAPLSLAVSPPYVIGRLSRFIEVRSLRPGHGLVQTIALSSITTLSGSSSSIVASSERDIHHIRPVPLGVQVVINSIPWYYSGHGIWNADIGDDMIFPIIQLAGVGRYEDALALCVLLSPEDAHMRASKEDSIHIRYGYHLFAEGKYEEAMEHFSKSTLDLSSILRLFPSLHLPAAAEELKGGSNDSTAFTFSVSGAGSDWLGDSGNYDQLFPGGRDIDGEQPELPTGGDLVYALGALVAFLSFKRTAAVQKAEAEQAEQDVLDLLKAGDKEGDRGEEKNSRMVSRNRSADDGGHIVHQTVNEDAKVSNTARNYATVLDTALVQALLALDSSAPTIGRQRGPELERNSSALMPFATDSALAAVKTSAFRNVYESALRLRDSSAPQKQTGFNGTEVFLQLLEGPNYCDVTTCEDKLLGAGRTLELITLYKQRGLHMKALQLLQELGKNDGPASTVEYLQALGAKEERLILEYSEWLLREHPQHGLKLFTTLDPPIPTGIVLEHFKNHCPPLRAAYLEHLLGTVGDTGSPAGLHDELVQLHLDRMVEDREKLLAEGGLWDESHISEARNKLLSILEKSSAYSPVVMLNKLPMGAFHLERAILLGKMRLHLPVLAVYARKLHDFTLCLNYCDQIFRAAVTSQESSSSGPPNVLSEHLTSVEATNIYLNFLQVCLDPVHTIQEFNRTLSAVLPAAKYPDESTVNRASGQTLQAVKKASNAYRVNISAPSRSFSSSFNDDDDEQSDGDVSVEESGAILSQAHEVQTVVIENEWDMDCNILMAEALTVLARRWDRIEPIAVLAMLPNWTIMKGLMPYLEPILRRASENHRNASVVKALRRAENFQVRKELLLQRQRTVKISGERSCAICHKRIGNSVFAVYPNNMVVHFVCHQDQLGRRRAGLATDEF